MELSGKRLLCHCRRGAPCHADAIAGAFAGFVMNAPTHDASLQVGGVYRDEVEFAGEALKLTHLFEAHACSTSVLNSLTFRMTTSTAGVACFRNAVLQHWRVEGRKLQGAEAVLHNSFHPDVEIIVGGKSLLLLRAMLRRVGLPSVDALLQPLGFPACRPDPRVWGLPCG